MHTRGKLTAWDGVITSTKSGSLTVAWCGEGVTVSKDLYYTIDKKEAADNAALIVSCVNGCKAVSEDNAKIVGENVAFYVAALRSILPHYESLARDDEGQIAESTKALITNTRGLLARIDGKE